MPVATDELSMGEGVAAGDAGAENKEEPNVANVWFKAAIWECSMWYFKPFKFL